MNRARRESLNCLNADKETLEFFAAQEQIQPSPELRHTERMPSNRNPGFRNRSKSVAYGLTWAQAMHGHPVDPPNAFGILNVDESNWSGPWVGPGSSNNRRLVGDDDVLNDEEQYKLRNRSSMGDGGFGGGATILTSRVPPTVNTDAECIGTPKLGQTWEATLERSIRAIVSITANHVRSFDTETSGNQQNHVYRRVLSVEKESHRSI